MQKNIQISEILMTGRDNAIPGRVLADMLDCNIRVVTEHIEKERRAGKEICASTDANNPGYYMAEYREELISYCDSLSNKAAELNETRRALLEISGRLPAAPAPD